MGSDIYRLLFSNGYKTSTRKAFKTQDLGKQEGSVGKAMAVPVGGHKFRSPESTEKLGAQHEHP